MFHSLRNGDGRGTGRGRGGRGEVGSEKEGVGGRERQDGESRLVHTHLTRPTLVNPLVPWEGGGAEAGVRW